jgi:signal transduction histidine kinase
VTLTTRLSLFFLAALAVVLAGFSATLYLLADAHLHEQIDDRARGALDTLAAAAEVEPGGVEWEPHTRPQVTEPRRGGSSVRWAVRAPGGAVLDATADPAGGSPLPEVDPHWHPFPYTDPEGRRWQVGCRRIEGLPGPTAAPTPGAKVYAHLTLTVAVPLEPVHATLRALAAALGGLSLAVLLVALVASRWVCRRALAPVARMAGAARSMGAADLSGRLPVPPAADELGDLGRAFNDRLDRLAAAFERERRFTAEASHQLRTPLAGIIGQVEVALRRERPGGEYRLALGAVLTQAGRLRRVIEALLFLARSEAEAALPGRERIDLSAWVPERLRAWADHPRSADVGFEASGGPVWADVHPDLFGELLDALLDNALKYSRAGARAVVRVGRDGGPWVEVEDRGGGIAAEDLPHLFRPFFRSDAARKRGVPGAGLGLAVAARIAAAHGGSLTAESEPGRGSRFRARLPQPGPTAAGAELVLPTG